MRKFRPPKPPRVNHKPDTSLIQHGTSKEELDLHKTINLLIPGVRTIKGDRAVLEGREIDIYIPKYRLGVEYDGLAYHSEGKTQDYHLWKTITAAKKRVRIIHIWSDLWTNRRAQVVDFLSKVLGRTTILPYSECTIGEVSVVEGSKFLNATHITGCDPRARVFIGIYYKNYLITVASFTRDETSWTYLQKADRATCCIEDDLAHIFEYIRAHYNVVAFRATIDRSLFDGSDLRQLGFRITECTPPNAHWTQNYKSRVLQEGYTDDQMISKGYHRFYDCGELILEWCPIIQRSNPKS